MLQCRMRAACLSKLQQLSIPQTARFISTLPNNSYIYVHSPSKPNEHILSYLQDVPSNVSLALGRTTTMPPTPDTFKQNEDFMKIVHWVIKEHATEDPVVQGQAAMFASQAGAGLGSGGVFFQNQGRNKRRANRPLGGGASGGDGAGGASSQGGMGGAGRGGYIHVSDQRNPPDFGRVAWPEDIFGSLELDGEGKFVEPKGRYQEAGTYRMCTNEGLLELSPYLRDKVRERVKELNEQMNHNK